MSRHTAHVLWMGPGHRIKTCVEVPIEWLAAYRRRVVTEWHGRIFGIYRLKDSRPHPSTERTPE